MEIAARRRLTAVGLALGFIVVVVGVIALLDDPSPDEPVLPRWAPPGNDVTISYGAWSPVMTFSTGGEVAVVSTHDDAAIESADEWTVVHQFT